MYVCTTGKCARTTFRLTRRHTYVASHSKKWVAYLAKKWQTEKTITILFQWLIFWEEPPAVLECANSKKKKIHISLK